MNHKIRFSDAHGYRPLKGVMLTLAPTDHAPTAPATQRVVMGRFVWQLQMARH
ncbi:hypothetical protein [Rhodoferax sp. PAMC 29310]|uniref:hypothetical protein n=1 Tax=Rhodoferax sp. PAMC 29310 TaxID=2822760 RepID=UPI001B320A2A|nr:hypothetical protein [Rhodoferax sp. PAMC 29310]